MKECFKNIKKILAICWGMQVAVTAAGGAVKKSTNGAHIGIANDIANARSTVPRAIAGLKDLGLLIERQSHVQGVSRKRKAYFLTDPGMKLAEETWKRLREFQLRAILPGGNTISSTLGEIQDKLPFTMRPVDVIRYLDDNAVLDARSLSADLVERDLSKHVEKQLVTSQDVSNSGKDNNEIKENEKA